MLSSRSSWQMGLPQHLVSISAKLVIINCTSQPLPTSTEMSNPVLELPTFLASLHPPFPGNFPLQTTGLC